MNADFALYMGQRFAGDACTPAAAIRYWNLCGNLSLCTRADTSRTTTAACT
jgi:hypothetical protein